MVNVTKKLKEINSLAQSMDKVLKELGLTNGTEIWVIMEMRDDCDVQTDGCYDCPMCNTCTTRKNNTAKRTWVEHTAIKDIRLTISERKDSYKNQFKDYEVEFIDAENRIYKLSDIDNRVFTNMREAFDSL